MRGWSRFPGGSWRILPPLFLALAGLAGARRLEAQGPGPRFVLELQSEAPEEFAGPAGGLVGPFAVTAVLRPRDLPAGGEGAQGWSIAVKHHPLLEIQRVTMEGTRAGEVLDRQTGFVHIEIIDPLKNGGQVGYIAAAILSTEGPLATLPSQEPSSLVIATYRGFHPAVTEPTETALSFEFADHLVGDASPIVNNVSYREESHFPDFLGLARRLRTTPTCNAGLMLSLQAPGSAPAGEVERLQLDIPAGRSVEVEATVSLTLTLGEGNGPEAWSLSVQHDPRDLEIVAAGVEGTDVPRFADPVYGFLKTDLVRDEGGTGFISVVILSREDPRTLPAEGRFSLARARYRVAAPPGAPGTLPPVSLRFQDGLRGMARNVFTIDRQSREACRRVPLELLVNVLPGPRTFLRGDPSGDGRVGLLDVVVALRALYLGGPSGPCPAAMDASGDLQLDAADPLSLLQYLFLRGAPPPAPFPACGDEPRPDSPLPCTDGGAACR